MRAVPSSHTRVGTMVFFMCVLLHKTDCFTSLALTDPIHPSPNPLPRRSGSEIRQGECIKMCALLLLWLLLLEFAARTKLWRHRSIAMAVFFAFVVVRVIDRFLSSADGAL